MDDEHQAAIESAVHRMTEGLPGHYFEEIRRVVVSRADQLAYKGAKESRAVSEALSELGPPAAARRLRAARGCRIVRVVPQGAQSRFWVHGQPGGAVSG